MLTRITATETLGPKVYLAKLEAPAVAAKAEAGQFVIVRVEEKGERIPLTIADWDRAEGTVTIVFMTVGAETAILATRKAGPDEAGIADLVGPLGTPSEISKFGTVVCVGGGVGVAAIFPIARALKQAGNQVVSIIGARNKDLLFWEEKMREASSELITCTDDGSYARKALVTEPLKEVLQQRPVHRVVVVGPTIMMKVCSDVTRPLGVKTMVSLNPIMLDGTGMCGCCRVVAAGVTKFACVDGPELDAHEIDWALLRSRQTSYLTREAESLKLWQERAASAPEATHA